MTITKARLFKVHDIYRYLVNTKLGEQFLWLFIVRYIPDEFERV